MNVIGYDAAALGNHEFNYGLAAAAHLRAAARLPAARRQRGRRRAPGGRRSRRTSSRRSRSPRRARRCKVGILGLTNPGIAIWDKANVEGKMGFPGLVEQAAKWVPELQAHGRRRRDRLRALRRRHVARRTATRCRTRERRALVAEQVPGIDAILVGHAHHEIAAAVRHQQGDRQAGRCCPSRCKWGKRLSRDRLRRCARERGRWTVQSAERRQVLNTNTVAEDPKVVAARAGRSTTRSSPTSTASIGTSTEAMSAATAPVRGHRRSSTSSTRCRPTRSRRRWPARRRRLPVLSIAAPFNRAAAFPAGRRHDPRRRRALHLRQHAARRRSSPAPRSRRTWSTRRSTSSRSPAPARSPIDHVTNAVTPTAPNGTPDYNYDIVGGLDAPLDLRHRHRASRSARGSPTSRTAASPVDRRPAVRDGGQQLPPVRRRQLPARQDGPVVYNAQVEIRQLLIDWVNANGVIDPADFASVRLAAGLRTARRSPSPADGRPAGGQARGHERR